MIYQSFKDGAVGVVWQIKTIVRHFDPSAHGVVFDEVHPIFQEQDKVSPMLHGADGIIFIKPRPTCAEYAGLEHGAVIHK